MQHVWKLTKFYFVFPQKQNWEIYLRRRRFYFSVRGSFPPAPVLLRYHMYRHLADYDFLQNDKEVQNTLLTFKNPSRFHIRGFNLQTKVVSGLCTIFSWHLARTRTKSKSLGAIVISEGKVKTNFKIQWCWNIRRNRLYLYAFFYQVTIEFSTISVL